MAIYHGENFWRIWFRFYNCETEEYEYTYEDVDNYEQARSAFFAAVQHGQELDGCIVISCINNYPESIILAYNNDWDDDFINFPKWAD